VEAYSLLEPDACANMGKEGEVETTVYGGNSNTNKTEFHIFMLLHLPA
jgi:hypothetical protein